MATILLFTNLGNNVLLNQAGIQGAFQIFLDLSPALSEGEGALMSTLSRDYYLNIFSYENLNCIP
jgi:hypothetical protein